MGPSPKYKMGPGSNYEMGPGLVPNTISQLTRRINCEAYAFLKQKTHLLVKNYEFLCLCLCLYVSWGLSFCRYLAMSLMLEHSQLSFLLALTL